MPTVIVNGKEIQIPERPRLNCIQAAERAGVEIPHYCYHPGLSVAGNCRMCLVEVGTRDPKTGKITMQPKLVPGCNTPAVEGTVIVTQSEKVRQAQAMVEEGLLLRHPIDCPICDKAGECLLQDYYFQYGQKERRADVKPFTSRRRDLGDVTLFVDRCILCTRCVRFTREISGTKELMVVNRGAHEEIDVVAGHPLRNNLSGNVVDLCPVGALADKDFLYQQRVWYMQSHPGVCTGCSTGCSIWIDENQDRIYRLRPRDNPAVNQWWMCNEGRYGYHHVHDPRRLTRPLRRGTSLPSPDSGEGQGVRASGSPGAATNLRSVPGLPSSAENTVGQANRGTQDTTRWTDVEWSQLVKELPERLREAGRLGVLLSPFLTVEEAYLLATFIRSVDENAVVALGKIPRWGDDERFPQGFTVRAEKCPNRRGVGKVAAYFMQKWISYEDVLSAVAAGEIEGLWVAGGYKTDWIDPAEAEQFHRLRLLVVQDLFPSPLTERATYQLPGAAWAEREGSYVNHADQLQIVPAAVRPPLGVRTEASLYWELLGRKGMFQARKVLDEIAREIIYFSAAIGPVPETGIDLKSNLLAEGGEMQGLTA
ncbi:MAG: 2Fe-2S iron-sulfur cluster binding domain-containing protein [Pirellulales bacterium]|nr:2Fe-2S iron-sulfur cluster binding domain-containing protein [Pirellulales bacterium]